MNIPLQGKQDGQAATEFIIAAAFILVPLFLIVPLIGKYIDIKHAAIQHARYTAWEYTVWAGEDGKVMADIDSSQSAGVKKSKDTTEEGIGFFFTDPTASSYGSSGVNPEVNPLWRDHRRDLLFKLSDLSTEVKEQDTPVPLGEIGKITQTLFQFLGDVISFFGQLLRMVGTDAQFDAINTKGYFSSDVAVTVRSLDQILPDYSLSGNASKVEGSSLQFKAKAAVQSNSWNAGSRKNATSESRGLVVTSLLSPLTTPINKGLGGLNKILDKVPLLKIKVPALPEFGYVEDDLIPFEHLEKNKKKLKTTSGLYSYE